MARNQVMKLWTAVVTAFLALCTALGLITTTATTAAARTEPTLTNGSGGGSMRTAHHAGWPTPTSHWARPSLRSLPPTMKQRIRAEAHGKTPSCRHRPPTDSAETETETGALAHVSPPLHC